MHWALVVPCGGLPTFISTFNAPFVQDSCPTSLHWPSVTTTAQDIVPKHDRLQTPLMLYAESCPVTDATDAEKYVAVLKLRQQQQPSRATKAETWKQGVAEAQLNQNYVRAAHIFMNAANAGLAPGQSEKTLEFGKRWARHYATAGGRAAPNFEWEWIRQSRNPANTRVAVHPSPARAAPRQPPQLQVTLLHEPVPISEPEFDVLEDWTACPPENESDEIGDENKGKALQKKSVSFSRKVMKKVAEGAPADLAVASPAYSEVHMDLFEVDAPEDPGMCAPRGR